MINVNVSDATASDTDLASLEQAALETVRLSDKDQDGAINADATILLTGDEQLQEMNLKYLDIDAPTDVLSFPAGYIDPDTNVKYLGDILISYERAKAQSAAGGHAVEQELILLVVHGMLHLLGYDHGAPEEKDEMWAAQARILKSLGCPLSPP
jgi:probable rRNA maturation factor